MNSVVPPIVEEALEALRRSTGVEGWRPKEAAAAKDGQVILKRHAIVQPYSVAWKTTIRSATALTLVRAQLEGRQPGLLVTTYLTPHLAERCRDIGLQFIDAAGNAYLDTEGLYVYVSGRRLDPAVLPTRARGSGNPTAMRMIFALLSRPSLLQASYREIAEASDIALGSVGTVFKELAARGWVLEPTIPQRRRLTAPDRLLDEWVANYPSILRPRLQGRRYATSDLDWWRTASQADLENSYWSGEVAAEKMTGHLRAEAQTLYIATEHKQRCLKQLMQNYRLRPLADGPIEILDVFWSPSVQDTAALPGVVPSILVYADLMASLSSRNLEMAAKLRAGIIQHALDQF
ncbi:type IV toxin-antitoxin system AbiEi family antitoxin [Cupriavidus pinatubonensis]|uniref:Uncharacterized protein n=1 Tax=Cupriavidus pinatubonensis TaxID=248026 RepID=A0ABM8Y384_9BURK|nr:type IV toxin-antitoxin system AbiEi family antitoxin [Cupriavidus pinatubonensis]CAG9187211.1 hypothetical protein LMG23994_06655 [Cupriavidus pinatubonensis]